MQKLWAEPHVSFKGRWHTIEDAGINPRPASGKVPVWFGGHHDRTLERIAKWGDGWMPNAYPPDHERDRRARPAAPADRGRRPRPSAGRDRGVGVDGLRQRSRLGEGSALLEDGRRLASLPDDDLQPPPPPAPRPATPSPTTSPRCAATTTPSPPHSSNQRTLVSGAITVVASPRALHRREVRTAEAVRPSRRPLRGLLRMTSILNAVRGLRHAEERTGEDGARLEARTALRQPEFTQPPGPRGQDRGRVKRWPQPALFAQYSQARHVSVEYGL